MSAARTGRRRFIGAAGMAMSVPLAGLGATVVEGAPADDSTAIRTLMHEEAARLGARPERFGSRDRIEVAPGGRSATATLPCVAVVSTAIGPDHPLVDMARQQGGGTTTRSEPGAIEYAFTKQAGVWRMVRAVFRPDR